GYLGGVSCQHPDPRHMMHASIEAWTSRIGGLLPPSYAGEPAIAWHRRRNVAPVNQVQPSKDPLVDQRSCEPHVIPIIVILGDQESLIRESLFHMEEIPRLFQRHSGRLLCNDVLACFQRFLD